MKNTGLLHKTKSRAALLLSAVFLLIGGGLFLLAANYNSFFLTEKTVVIHNDADSAADINAASINKSAPAPTAAETSAPTSGESTAPPDRRNKKLVALTFDDGPKAELTPKLLDVLKEQDVKATFFEIGMYVDAMPDITRRVAEEGHQVASHSWRHKDLVKLTPEKLEKDIADTSAAIKKATGKAPAMLRPPYGSFNDAVSDAFKGTIALWSVDPRDWSVKNADSVYKNVMKVVKDGDIVLLHDIYPSTIAAVEKLIPTLKDKGFTFVTVEEMVAARPEACKNRRIYNAHPAPKAPKE